MGSRGLSRQEGRGGGAKQVGGLMIGQVDGNREGLRKIESV